MREFEVEDVGLSDDRLENDEDVVDCSHRIFELTNLMMMSTGDPMHIAAFSARRWCNLVNRDKMEITDLPSDEEPLLYIGNPIKVFHRDTRKLEVIRMPEFLIRTGMQLGY